MSIHSQSFPDDDLIVVTHIGLIPDDEFLGFYNAFFTGGALRPSMNLLVDLRQADSSPRSSEVLRHLAGSLRRLPVEIAPGTKVAVVAPEDLAYGLARMYGTLADAVSWEFSVFRSMKDARKWLGLPEDAVREHPGQR